MTNIGRMNDTTNPTSSELHVILGAGQIGTRLTRILAAKGHRVRNVRRSAWSEAAGLPGVERVQGDITDLAFAEEVTRGAAVVYDTMNPAYHEWLTLLMPIARGSLHGAARSGARLVALDCLYMYGKAAGPMNEDTPIAPVSKKGELRAELGELRLDAHRRGEARVTIGRASDFFGPGLPYSAWSDRFFERILSGKPGECMGDPDMPHAYTYAEDVARALATLGARPEAEGRVWMLPTPAAESTRALTKRLGRALGVEADAKRVPKWVVRGLGVFSPFLREVVEMMYQWEMPFEVDDRRFRETFGYGATAIEAAVEATAAWARGRFGGERRGMEAVTR